MEMLMCLTCFTVSLLKWLVSWVDWVCLVRRQGFALCEIDLFFL